MLNRVGSWFMDLIFGSVPEKPRPLPRFSVEQLQEWVFPNPAPTAEVVQKLNEGLQSVDDHIMYRSQDTGRYAGSVQVGTERWLAKELTYWIADGKLKDGHKYNSIRAECGEQRCVRPDHLEVKYSPSKAENATKKKKKAKPELEVNRIQGPPVYKAPAKRKLAGISKDELLAGDRTKCASAKVFIDTLAEAQQVASYYNSHFRPAGQQRLYGYDCDWCAGYHLTHHNPKKHNFKHKGSWS